MVRTDGLAPSFPATYKGLVELGRAIKTAFLCDYLHAESRLTERDRQGLSPLVYAHMNPYGRFDLDLGARLAL